MIYVPFIYFTILTVFFAVKKKDFDISVFMSGLFAFTSLMAIVIVKADILGDAGILFTKDTLDLQFVPTLLYCILPTIAILPFARFSMRNIEKITIVSDKIFMFFSICLLFIALLNIYVSVDKFIDIFKNGTWLTKNCGGSPSYTELWQAKTNHYNGELHGYQIRIERLPLIFGYIFYFSNCTLLLIPCFFYSLCVAKKKWWFNVILIIGSISSLAISMQTADRTEFFNYALIFIVNLLIFKHLLNKQQWIKLAATLIPIFVVFVIYFVGVTKARFHTDESGELKGIVQYSGQSYLNFNYFYENAKTDTVFYERTFPLTSHFLMDNDYEYQSVEKRNAINGFKTNVFASFLGTFLLDMGKMPMILWVLAFFVLCILILPRPKEKTVSFWKIMVTYTLATVPVFGIFYYRYFHFTFALIPCIAFIMLVISTIQTKIKSKK